MDFFKENNFLIPDIGYDTITPQCLRTGVYPACN